MRERARLAGRRVVLNLSGRGDKDMATIEALLGQERP
jgi:tryptophan synthase beta subunit